MRYIELIFNPIKLSILNIKILFKVAKPSDSKKHPITNHFYGVIIRTSALSGDACQASPDNMQKLTVHTKNLFRSIVPQGGGRPDVLRTNFNDLREP